MPADARPDHGPDESRAHRRPRPTRRPTGCSSRSLRRWPSLTVDPKRSATRCYAHADQLSHRRAPARRPCPALLPGRRDGHTAGGGSGRAHRRRRATRRQLPDCARGALPAGLSVVRGPARDSHSQNTFVTVLTTQTSPLAPAARPARRPGEQTPTAHHRAQRRRRPPHLTDPAVSVAWSAPATDGGAAVTAYRVYLDGTLSRDAGGQLRGDQEPGPGEHTIEVKAVNGSAEGPRAVRHGHPRRAVEAAEGRRRPRRGGREADGGRQVEAAGRARAGWPSRLQDRGLQEGRRQGRHARSCRPKRQVPLEAEVGPY